PRRLSNPRPFLFRSPPVRNLKTQFMAFVAEDYLCPISRRWLQRNESRRAGDGRNTNAPTTRCNRNQHAVAPCSRHIALGRRCNPASNLGERHDATNEPLALHA